MEQPLICCKVCHFSKSSYGLKQSPIAWLGTFAHVVHAFGMKQSISDDFIFYKHLIAVLFYWLYRWITLKLLVLILEGSKALLHGSARLHMSLMHLA